MLITERVCEGITSVDIWLHLQQRYHIVQQMCSSYRHPRNRFASIHVDNVDVEVVCRESQCPLNLISEALTYSTSAGSE